VPVRPEQSKGYFNAYRRRQQDEIVERYGGRCAKCGFDNAAALSLEPKRGARPPGWRSPCQRYALLRREGFPRGKYHLLCANCKLVEASNGRRPHKRKG